MRTRNGAPRAKPAVPPQEYPPTPPGAEALRCAGAKASEGYPPVAKSAEAVIPRFTTSTDTAHAFIVRRHRLWPTASTGRARGLLRRRITYGLLRSARTLCRAFASIKVGMGLLFTRRQVLTFVEDPCFNQTHVGWSWQEMWGACMARNHQGSSWMKGGFL